MFWIIIGILGLTSGFLGATVGGGGLISIPGMLLLGIPPHVAVATNNIGDIGAFGAAIKQYWSAKKINWRIAGIMTLIVLGSSIIGTQLFDHIDATLLRYLIIVTSVLFLPLIIFIRPKNNAIPLAGRLPIIVSVLLYAGLTIIGTLTGSGTTSLILLGMVIVLQMNIVKSYATLTVPELCAVTIPAVIYTMAGYTDLKIGLVLLLTNATGGWLGARFALTSPNASTILKTLLVIIVLVLLTKLLFGW